ncbi:nicotinate (nicotinamide) nucleotide adenylyltransferase [Castellaniella denitrificans]|uniref:nicotinate (nicotinamide) nucleotide adenylyltransferase n=1 Tax=Castellaniella denitrificans TaxID=56119 RepID=UPI001AD07C3C|nr:nicotinate (nicotinamide) nucleotide adenylyltransferase [Burkholderiales bacterium]
MAVTPQVGLLGGSFDPVHRAHIALAQAARDALDLEHVELLPAARPWQRGRLGAAPEHRLRMLELACAGDPRLRVNPIELLRDGDTYTIDTLAALPAAARYTWILGSDQLANFCTWHRWRDLLRHVRLAVAERPGTPVAPPPELERALAPGGLVRIPFTPRPISATAIRRDLAAGRPVDTMLDPRVLDYIRTHRLYLDPETP